MRRCTRQRTKAEGGEPERPGSFGGLQGEEVSPTGIQSRLLVVLVLVGVVVPARKQFIRVISLSAGNNGNDMLNLIDPPPPINLFLLSLFLSRCLSCSFSLSLYLSIKRVKLS